MKTPLGLIRSWPAVVACVLLAVLALGGCTSDEEPVVRVKAGQVVEVPATAVDVDHRVQVGLPSGVLTLGLTSGLDPVSTGTASLAPEPDVTMIGLTWSFEPHPSSEARDVLLDGQDPRSLPQPAVSLLDGSEAIEVSISAQAGQSGGVVVGVTDPTGIEVEYDGLTQTVDLDTGAVGAGQAEGLTELGEATTTLRRACPARDFPPVEVLENGCRVEAVHRLPYILALGWAPNSQSWLVVDARINGAAAMLLGGDLGTVLEGAPPNVQRVAFVVAGNVSRSVDFDFGPPIGTVSVPLET